MPETKRLWVVAATIVINVVMKEIVVPLLSERREVNIKSLGGRLEEFDGIVTVDSEVEVETLLEGDSF